MRVVDDVSHIVIKDCHINTIIKIHVLVRAII